MAADIEIVESASLEDCGVTIIEESSSERTVSKCRGAGIMWACVKGLWQYY